MTFPMNRRLQQAGAVLALALASGLAAAGDDALVRTKAVPYGDLNLNNAQGVATLYWRINSAAQEVCAPERLPGSPFVSRAYKDCVAQAVSGAVAAIGRAELGALYAGRGDQRP